MEPEVTTSPPANVEVEFMPLTFMRVAKVEEDVVLKFPEMSKATCGLVNPMPTKPSPVRRMTSVNWVPDWRVEKIKEPVALEKF